MPLARRSLVPASLIAICAFTGLAARADDGSDPPNRYMVNRLTSDLPGVAQNTDSVLQNAWGVAFTPGASPFWVADNATGCSTLYDGTGLPQPQPTPLRVKIPLPGNVVPDTACQMIDPNNPNPPMNAAPTGIVWSPTTAFLVPNTTPPAPAIFIFDTEDGTISAWTGGLSAAVEAVNNSPGAVYKGLAVGVNVHGVFLFATNFRAGTVDVFDNTYMPFTTDGGFVDPDIPGGFAPFGIQNINGDLFVTYAKQDAAKHDDVAGAGNGFIDVFDTDGHFLRRFASKGPLNSPWGVARASFAFGRFSGDILVGNFGNGKINAFDSNGHFLGALRDINDKPIVLEGLWTLTLGGGRNSSSDTLYFTSGPNDEKDGLFGTITPVQTSN